MSKAEQQPQINKRSIPDGVWTKCDKCKAIIFDKEFRQSFKVCPKCDHHHRLDSAERLSQLIDPNTFKETHRSLKTQDVLGIDAEEKYEDYYQRNVEKTGLNEAIVTGTGKIEGIKTAIAVMDFRFIGGSMGYVVGEKITLSAETAIKSSLPLLIVTASGGARMHEGMLSLMQMAKTSSAISKLQDKGLPFISLLTDPTSGGVFASFATQADLILAEPNTFIGFAGPRVIEKTIRQRLPDGFQTSEFLLKHGMIDAIIKRVDQKEVFVRFLKFFGG